jgi:hypothetical protein
MYFHPSLSNHGHQDKDESRYRTSRSANAGDSGWTIGDSSGISAKEVNMWKKEFNA